MAIVSLCVKYAICEYFLRIEKRYRYIIISERYIWEEIINTKKRRIIGK